MKKVVVTGAGGFTGRYVVSELKSRGYDVIEFVRKKNATGQVECDLTDKQSVKLLFSVIRPNYVIHLAALSFVAHDDVRAFYDTNLFIALNILEVCYELNLELSKVIISSSANVYGNAEVELISESQVPAPISHYAISKLAMEYVCKLWFDKFPILIVRPFNYTGLGQSPKFLIPKIVSHFQLRKKEIELGNLDVFRDFSDVRDVSNYYVDLLESAGQSDIVNLCSGSIYSLSFIVKKMEAISGYEISIKASSDFIREKEIKILGGDDSKLRNLTNRKPIFTLNETLADMYFENFK
ncbi:NAD-dependent epimerase/dehydratase family protein [Marinomonas primoryensis]|uniref:NAD-dependent epimerase/dehydratase family protein n=1 Tax=Marinomonas primoryensis TaxID=178399 RepID=A0ABV0KZ33_9GAMM